MSLAWKCVLVLRDSTANTLAACSTRLGVGDFSRACRASMAIPSRKASCVGVACKRA